MAPTGNGNRDLDKLLTDTTRRALLYTREATERRVAPAAEAVARLELLAEPLPERPCDAGSVLALLDEVGSPATVASTGSRYFGFVTGGVLPAALAANWLTGAWDQNAGLSLASPVAARLETIALEWLRDLLDLPVTSAGGFVTGATMANFTGLAAARHALLERAGWNVEEDGLFDAPALSVIIGAEAHVSLRKALSLLGMGRARVSEVPTDEQGRMRGDALPRLDDRTILCIQAGNVNTGAFDPAVEICRQAREAAAWVHVDGAFGLWAAAAPARKHLLRGFADADSWATDCHKWLNVPYDSGLALVREPRHLFDAMAVNASYLELGTGREPSHYTPELSRRARGIEVWAALKSLGRSGVAEIVEGNCRQASWMAERLKREGYAVLNDVVLNQLLVSFGNADSTRKVIAAIQADGTCWCGGTQWHGQTAMRISFSSWATTQSDIEKSAETILRMAKTRRA